MLDFQINLQQLYHVLKLQWLFVPTTTMRQKPSCASLIKLSSDNDIIWRHICERCNIVLKIMINEWNIHFGKSDDWKSYQVIQSKTKNISSQVIY